MEYSTVNMVYVKKMATAVIFCLSGLFWDMGISCLSQIIDVFSCCCGLFSFVKDFDTGALLLKRYKRS